MELINLTPHDVVIIQDGQVVRKYAPSGMVAKLLEQDIPAGSLDGISVVRKEYGTVVLLSREDFLGKKENPTSIPMPEVEPDDHSLGGFHKIYIVPMLVGQQLAGQRSDIYGPDFGIGGVRTADGKISGAVGWIKY